ncbi:MAG: O-antigen ligase C-terminal domain-containing protein, partial [Nitrosomonadales bacterium]|nr:O-antigen ligase C-terminal domain-containing protein [Nitrosomonadales bacterium]
MLKNKQQPIRLADIKLVHISLALVGLMWVLPFLHYRHKLPLTTFDQELWSALLGVLALTLLVARDFWQYPEFPRIVQLPAALIALVWLQWGLGKIVYFDQAILYVLYLLFAALLMVLGVRLRDCFGMARLAQVLAIFLLIGAELSAFIGVLQHYLWHTFLDKVIVAKVSSSVYGNLAQPNHFANYISLGLISLGLLYQQKRLRAGYVAALAAPLLFVMTLSGSRSSWLYLLMMCGLAWLWARRDAVLRPLLHYSLFLIAGFGAMHLVVQMPFMAGAGRSVDTVQRLFGGDASGGIRLYLWREAGLMFTQSPWLGVGFGQFAWHHFQLLPELQQGNIMGLYNNAHNLIFQLAAEAGIAGLLALFAPMGVWLYGLYRRNVISIRTGPMENGQHSATLDAASWWGYAALGVLVVHSMLEYPLWYTYFVAVAAILLGALDETRYRLKLHIIGRLFVAAALLSGLVVLIQLNHGYRDLQQTLAIYPKSRDDYDAPIRDRSDKVQRSVLLSPYVDILLSSQIVVNDNQLEEKLALNTRVMQFMPTDTVVYRHAMLLAQDNRQEQAKSMLEQAIWSYPGGLANACRQMAELAEKDSEHFSALLEFALRKEQEHRRA